MTAMRASVTGDQLLRRVLVADALFCALSGAALVAFARPLAERFGVERPAVLLVLGAALLVAAPVLWLNARRAQIDRAQVWLSVGFDLVWVAVSWPLIFFGPLTAEGNWVAGIAADVVFLFGVLQYLGLRRQSREALAA